jgi:hypothetical protein
VSPQSPYLLLTACCRTVDRRRKKLKHWRSTVRQICCQQLPYLSTQRQICLSSTARRPGTKFPVGPPATSPASPSRLEANFFHIAHPVARTTMTEAEGAAAIAAASTGHGEGGARGHASTAATSTISSTNGSSATSNDGSSSDASGGGSVDNENSSRRIVSPFSQHTDEFPPQFLCPILSNEPPVDGAYFDVPGADNQISAQVFEYSSLYRLIASNERWPSRRFGEVRHPINGGWVRRDQALALVRRVSVETQEILNAERTRLRLPLVDSDPITEEVRDTYRQMIANIHTYRQMIANILNP